MIYTSQLTDEQFEKYLLCLPTVSGGKGDQTVKSGEKAQLSFNNTLMTNFSQRFGAQTPILQGLAAKMTEGLTNPQGYSATNLAAMRTSATENAAKATANAQQATNLGIASKGGSALPSGVSAQLTAQNNVAGAALDATSQNEITQANENMRQQNYWKSAGTLLDTSSQLNPSGLAQDANSGGNALANESGAFNASNQSQLLGALGGAVGGIAGAVGTYYGGGAGRSKAGG